MKLCSIKYIMMFMLFFNSSIAFSSEDVSSEEFSGGQVTLDLDNSEDEVKPTLVQSLELLVEANNFFEKNYPGEKIEDDMSDDLIKFFPDLNQQELLEKEKAVRRIVKTYRFGRNIYEYFKTKKVVPEEPAIVVDSSQYTSTDKEDYIETEDGKVAVITDIKKVVSYSADPRDMKAMSAKREKDLESKDRKNKYEKLYSMFKKVEWKKFFTGEVGYSPFTGGLGIGYWYKTDEVYVRYLAERSHIDNSRFINMLLDFQLQKGYFIKASSLEKNPYFSIDFSKSKNYKASSIFYPFAKRLNFANGETAAGYVGNFSIPIILEVSSLEEDLDLQTKILVDVCDVDNICHKKELNPFFDLDYGEGMNSVSNNYITQEYASLPLVQDEKIKFLSAVSKEENGKKLVEIKLNNQYNIEHVNVFIESKDGIKFFDPVIFVDKNIIFAKAKQFDSSQNLIGKEIRITAVVNDLYSIRSNLVITEKPLFDMINSKIPLTIILLALFSGFAINFMPPILPLFAKQLAGINQYGGRKYRSVLSSFVALFMGVLSSILVLALIILYLNVKSIQVSWGMQFQSPIFLSSIFFILLFFMADVLGVVKVSKFSFITNNFKKNDISFFMGVLVFLFALSFGSPYLGTVLGYIINTTYTEIIIIMLCLLIGFFIPYLLFICFPIVSYVVPKSKYWSVKNQRIILLLLMFSLIWIFFVYSSFAGFLSAGRLILYAVLLYIILYFRKNLLLEIETSIVDANERKFLSARFNKTTTILMLILYFVAIYDARYAYQKQSVLQSNNQTEIDYAAIAEYIDEGKIVVVNITADWCMSCKLNDFTVFGNSAVKSKLYNDKAIIMHIDWTRYNQDVLNFMQDYGRSSPPFSVVYSKSFKEGFVMPEILNETIMYRTVGNISR